MPKIIAATGHRPDKLGGYGSEVLTALTDLALRHLRQERPDRVVSGMALGWDTAVALAAIKLKIPLIAAVPHDDQAFIWPPESQRRWERIIARASAVHVVSPGPYAVWKMHARNEWLVNRATDVLALWSGAPGGTARCVQIAKKRKRRIVNVWDEWLLFRLKWDMTYD